MYNTDHRTHAPVLEGAYRCTRTRQRRTRTLRNDLVTVRVASRRIRNLTNDSLNSPVRQSTCKHDKGASLTTREGDVEFRGAKGGNILQT